jgi:hypothetical protein
MCRVRGKIRIAELHPTRDRDQLSVDRGAEMERGRQLIAVELDPIIWCVVPKERTPKRVRVGRGEFDDLDHGLDDIHLPSEVAEEE